MTAVGSNNVLSASGSDMVAVRTENKCTINVITYELIFYENPNLSVPYGVPL